MSDVVHEPFAFNRILIETLCKYIENSMKLSVKAANGFSTQDNEYIEAVVECMANVKKDRDILIAINPNVYRISREFK